MKCFLSLWALFITILSAAELEVRCYQVNSSTIRRAYWDSVKDHDIRYDDKNWLGETIKEASFQSRFFKEAEILRDVTQRIGEMIRVTELKGEAVYCEKSRRLVVKSDVHGHTSIKRHLERQIEWNLRTEVAVYESAGVLRTKRDHLSQNPPKDAQLLTRLTCKHVPGLEYFAKTASGDLAVQIEGQIDVDYDDAELRAEITYKGKGGSAYWKTGFALPRGVFAIHELGSQEGKSTLLLGIKVDLVSSGGFSADTWIKKENDDFFLRRQRLLGLQMADPLNLNRKVHPFGFYQYHVPPTFVTFISHAATYDESSDPFASESQEKKDQSLPIFESLPEELKGFRKEGLLDVSELLKNNGVAFRPGDFIALNESESLIYVKLSDINRELLQGILLPAGQGTPRGISIDLLEVELTDTTESWKSGERTVLQKMSILAFPGLPAEVHLGERLKAEIEAQIDANDDLIEMRVALAQDGDLEKPMFKTGLTTQNDTPTLIHETETDGKRTAWIVTARILAMDREISELIKREKVGQ